MGESSDFLVRALEAQRFHARRHELQESNLKPCIAVLLDGNLGGAARHDAAFCIAIEMRRMGLDEAAARRVLQRWARNIHYSPRQAERAITSAYRRTTDGGYRYHPPGISKKGAVYQRTMAPICAELGCPDNCLAFADRYRGSRNEDYAQFVGRGWKRYLCKKRLRAPIEVYRALVYREKELGFAAGAPLRADYRQLADLADVDPKTVGRSLRTLQELGLVRFEPGRGSGPTARDRVASTIQRIIPIPEPPST